MGDVINFPSRMTKCAKCKRPMIRSSGGSEDDAYCQYKCGAEAQPEHTLSVRNNGQAQ